MSGAAHEQTERPTNHAKHTKAQRTGGGWPTEHTADTKQRKAEGAHGTN